MTLARRRLLVLAAAALSAAPSARVAWAQTYPARPIRWIVGFAPGGSTDFLARVMGPWLSERLGQPIVVENRPGGGSNIATEAVVNSAPDGYTLLMISPAHAVNATLYGKLNYVFLRDIAPVAGISREANVMVVNPSFPAKTVPEFVAYAKAHPGAINMASSGNGTSVHVAGALFNMMAGIKMLHVPYRGAGPAITDLLGGQVQVMFAAMPSAIEHVRAGQLRALAVTTAARSSALPDVPSVGEFIPGYEASSWYGIGVPRGTPVGIIDALNKAVNGGPRRSEAQCADRRSRRHHAGGHARGIRKAHCRRDGEVGEGGEVLRRQGGLIRLRRQRIEGDVMMDLRRRYLQLAAAAVAACGIASPCTPSATAQTYPTRPVHVIVATAAGATTDIIARLIAQSLTERLGQQFLIENRPGAGNTIGTEVVVRSPPDGYTLLLVNAVNAINVTLFPKLNYDFANDIVPVAGIIRVPLVMQVNPGVPAKSVPEFLAYAKANPGKINMASAGTGSTPHVAGELFKMMAGVDLVHVPYRGGAPAMTDLIAGQVQVMFEPVAGPLEHLRAGRLRALAVTTETRSPALPEVPTVGEFVPGYEASSWYGIGVPKGTPAEVIDTLNRAVNAALADPKLQARFADLGATVLAGSPADFGRLVADETEKWRKVVKFSGAKAE